MNIHAEKDIVKWLDLEIKRIQDCPKNCTEKSCVSEIEVYIKIRESILTGRYMERLEKLQKCY